MPELNDLLAEAGNPIELEIREHTGVFPTKAAAQAFSSTVAPTHIRLEGYYSVGDGGGALYADPVTVDPGTTDTVQVTINGVPTWYRRVHDGAIDLVAHGLKGDGTNETTLFEEALQLAWDYGFNKLICRDKSRTFKIVEVELTEDIEIDLGGASLLGDFGAWGVSTVDSSPIHWTKQLLFTQPANDVSVTLRNMTINGQNDPTFQMAGGLPLCHFEGGKKALLDNVTMTRGSNRRYTSGSGIAAPTLILDYRNAEMFFYNVDLVEIDRCEFRSSPGEMVVVQSDDASTILRLSRSYFTKIRDQNPAQKWSSSGLNVFNIHPASEMRNCRFYYFGKGPVNWESDGGLIESCVFDYVDDSSGIDFSEARLIRQNQFVVRNCFFRDIVTVGIRLAASNTLIENNTFDKVNICISYEGAVVGTADRGAWVKVIQTALYNNVVRNNRIIGFSASHANLIIVRALGASASLPIQLRVDGSSLQDRPSPSKPLYAIWGEHVDLILSGYHAEGRTAVVYLTGTCSVRARDCIFAPEEAEGVHTFHLDAVTMGKKGLVIENCKRVTNLAAGQYDFRNDGSTLDLDAIHVNGSPNFAGTTNNAIVALNGVLVGSVAFNPASTASGAQVSTTVTVNGARLGDKAEAFASISLGGMIVTAFVSASNTVTVIYANLSGAAIDLVSHTVTAHVTKV